MTIPDFNFPSDRKILLQWVSTEFPDFYKTFFFLHVCTPDNPKGSFNCIDAVGLFRNLAPWLKKEHPAVLIEFNQWFTDHCQRVTDGPPYDKYKMLID